MDNDQVFSLALQLRNALPNVRGNEAAVAAAEALMRELAVESVPFVYSAIFTSQNSNALTAGGQQTFQINIQQDAAFRIRYGAFYATIADAAQTSGTLITPNVSVQLTDAGSGRFFFDRAVPVPSVFGNGQNPFPWPVPMTMAALSTLQVQAFSFEAAATINLYLAFIGEKLYKYSRA